MTPLLQLLRDETRASHERLEGALRIQEKVADRAEYRRLLAGFLGLYEPLESQVGAHPGLEDLGYIAAARRKAPALAADLAALGLRESEIAAVPRSPAAIATDAATALGCAYVMEGATMGGQAITRLLAEKAPDFPRRFFGVYGDGARAKWMEFQECLAAFERTDGDRAAVARAARETFEAFHGWLV